MRPPSVVIAGAGLGGLSTAVFLGLLGVDTLVGHPGDWRLRVGCLLVRLPGTGHLRSGRCVGRLWAGYRWTGRCVRNSVSPPDERP